MEPKKGENMEPKKGEEMSGRQAGVEEMSGRQAGVGEMSGRQSGRQADIPPQTHGGLRETILSLEVKARKGLGERGLVKISASWS